MIKKLKNIKYLLKSIDKVVSYGYTEGTLKGTSNFKEKTYEET